MLEETDDIFVSAIQDPGDDIFDASVDLNSTKDLPNILSSPSAPPAEIVEPATSSSSNPKPSSEPTALDAGSKLVRQPIEIFVVNPEKVGEGMSAFVVYTVRTKTTIPVFNKKDFFVKRRFSDFLGLHCKLVSKHLSQGYLVPPAPEKNMIGMTKIKIIKEESNSAEFLERRRASLERFLNRIAQRERLLFDPELREFLEFEGDLPKSVNTQALSSAGVMRLFKNVGEAVNKFTYHMDETDPWFEEKQNDIENLERQIVRLYTSFDSLVSHRMELARQTKLFSQSCSQLATVEECLSLSQALTKLADTEDQVEQLHSSQAQAELYLVAEVLRDYVALLAVIKELFHERVKSHKAWKDAELALTKKRETKVRLELQHKNDKANAMNAEIRDAEERVDKTAEDFSLISKTIRNELEEFDLYRVHEFKQSFLAALEKMVENQEKIIRCWESFLPHVKASS